MVKNNEDRVYDKTQSGSVNVWDPEFYPRPNPSPGTAKHGPSDTLEWLVQALS